MRESAILASFRNKEHDARQMTEIEILTRDILVQVKT